jgi:hypothetical protein
LINPWKAAKLLALEAEYFEVGRITTKRENIADSDANQTRLVWPIFCSLAVERRMIP